MRSFLIKGYVELHHIVDVTDFADFVRKSLGLLCGYIVTMHACLTSKAVLKNVCDILFADPAGGRETVAALARTCRAFEDPALDVLWRTLPSLASLVQIMPSDAWEIKSETRQVDYSVSILVRFPRFSVPIFGFCLNIAE